MHLTTEVDDALDALKISLNHLRWTLSMEPVSEHRGAWLRVVRRWNDLDNLLADVSDAVGGTDPD